MLSATRTSVSPRPISIAKLLFALTLACALGISARAQSTYGSLVGIVTDASGGVIPDAKVTLTNTATTESRTALTSATGAYQFVNLIPGHYDIAIEKTGFKRKVLAALQVE